MKSATFKAFDASKYVDGPEAELVFLQDAFDSGDVKVISAAIGEVARARGMSQLARDAGVSRESLYRSLSEDGNPRLDTLLKIFGQLGIKLSAKPVQDSDAA